MRGRNKPWAKDFIATHRDYLYQSSADFSTPCYLEIGMGKGDFIIASCKYSPQVHHVGIEINTSIFALALKKIVQEEINNIQVANIGADKLLEYFPEHSVEKIFLNFSDPWPKARHEKRRLVHPHYLSIFEKLLKKDGQICFKTDNCQLFDYGVEVFQERKYSIFELSYDYQLKEGDFMSEYERRFRSLGQPIYRCIVQPSQEEKNETK